VLLYDEGRELAADAEPGERGRRGFSEEQATAVVESGGKVPVRQILRRRVRYFCDGAVLGTAEFVDKVFRREQACRQRFGLNRQTGARKLRGAAWGELRVLRDLRRNVIGVP